MYYAVNSSSSPVLGFEPSQCSWILCELWHNSHSRRNVAFLRCTKQRGSSVGPVERVRNFLSLFFS